MDKLINYQEFDHQFTNDESMSDSSELSDSDMEAEFPWLEELALASKLRRNDSIHFSDETKVPGSTHRRGAIMITI